MSYRIGRLSTYLMLGALMGGLGNVADGLAVGSGSAPIAARWVGGLMVVMGLAILVKWWRGRPGMLLMIAFGSARSPFSRWSRWELGGSRDECFHMRLQQRRTRM